MEAGVDISYGRIFRTGAQSRIATLPVGYADGYSRLLSGRGRVLINGEFAPIVGRICMDQCMVDITGFKSEVKTGDEVVLIGRQNGRSISAEDVADCSRTIN